jgi:hypothetical protein
MFLTTIEVPTYPPTYLPTYGSAALCWALIAFSVTWSFTQSVRLLGRGISPSQGRYLYSTTQIEYTHTDIHASSGIRTHDPSIWAGEDNSCSRPRGHCDWLQVYIHFYTNNAQVDENWNESEDTFRERMINHRDSGPFRYIEKEVKYFIWITAMLLASCPFRSSYTFNGIEKQQLSTSLTAIPISCIWYTEFESSFKFLVIEGLLCTSTKEGISSKVE